MHIMMVVRLHPQHQVSFLYIGLGGTESCAICIKSGIVTLMPAVGVECIEVILPIEIESTSLVIISICLNIVVEQIPWHVLSIKTFSPRLKRWSPEVHHDGLRLVHVSDSWVSTLDSSNFFMVKTPRDVMWGPLHLVDVPLVRWIEAAVIVV